MIYIFIIVQFKRFPNVPFGFFSGLWVYKYISYFQIHGDVCYYWFLHYDQSPHSVWYASFRRYWVKHAVHAHRCRVHVTAVGWDALGHMLCGPLSPGCQMFSVVLLCLLWCLVGLLYHRDVLKPPASVVLHISPRILINFCFTNAEAIKYIQICNCSTLSCLKCPSSSLTMLFALRVFFFTESTATH